MSGRMLKYQIASNASDQTDVLMREGAVIRAVAVQEGSVFVWAEVPVQAPLTDTRTFCVIGTGRNVPDPGTYLGTVFDGPFVWHVYEIEEARRGT